MPRRGSSPRMRGTPYGARAAFKSSVAHPHVCGEHAAVALGTAATTAWQGLIPTYAGNTSEPATRRAHYRAHPHVCGEHDPTTAQAERYMGSSPRMRGTHPGGCVRGFVSGLIPTYAGNTRLGGRSRCVQRAHPHVCGEHFLIRRRNRPLPGSSPRMRGTHLLTWGFIPTHQVLELVWSPKPVLTLHDFRAYRRREARLYLLALLHPFRGPRSSFGADGRIISFTPSKSTGSHG